MDNRLGQAASTFSTPDTALAAWLCLKGIPLSRTQAKHNPDKPLETSVEFFFLNDGNSNKLDDLKDAFQAGEAYGNIVGYMRHYNILNGKAKKQIAFR